MCLLSFYEWKWYLNGISMSDFMSMVSKTGKYLFPTLVSNEYKNKIYWSVHENIYEKGKIVFMKI